MWFSIFKKIMKINHEKKNSNQSGETYLNYYFKSLPVENFTLLIFQTFLVILWYPEKGNIYTIFKN